MVESSPEATAALAMALAAIFYGRRPNEIGAPGVEARHVLSQLEKFVLVREDEAEELLRVIHELYTWQNGGDHPNTHDLRKCGSCERIRAALAARRSARPNSGS
jgi:hypothetical protein